MKKLLLLLSAAALTMTSCMKGDDTYKKLEPVIPGLNIYNGATTQQRIASVPVDQAVRLAMLLAEADVQGKLDDDLTKITVTKDNSSVNVFSRLFPAKTTITKTPGGDYTIELKPEVIGYYGSGEGTITVKTNGAPLLAGTSSATRWEISLSEGFKVVFGSNSQMGGTQELQLEGSSSIYKTGTMYGIDLNNMRAHMKTSTTIASNWNGRFLLTPPTGGESLAYSTCLGKKFKFDGNAQGPSCITFDGTSSTELSYKVVEGLYANTYTCVNGTEEAKLNGYFDYNTSYYPATDVRIVWELSADGGSYSQTIYYNNFVVKF